MYKKKKKKEEEEEEETERNNCIQTLENNRTGLCPERRETMSLETVSRLQCRVRKCRAQWSHRVE